ncbi:MAG: hypothetical protein U0Q12_20765 [Vicinamibacterales bacterium]
MSLRAFRVGLALIVLFALGHLMGFMSAAYDARHDPALADVTAMMRAHRSPLMGFAPSLLDFREYASLCYSLLLGGCAAIGWPVTRMVPVSPAHVGAVCRAYVVLFAVLAIASLVYGVAQGIISGTIIAVVFAIAAPRRVEA